MSMIDRAAEGATKKDLAAILSGYVGKERRPNNREGAIKAIILACGDSADPAFVIGRGLTLLRQGEEITRETLLKVTEGDKQEQRRARGQLVAEVEQLLRRSHGATVAEICEVTGWQPHTARGRISDRFRGMVRTERVRNVGPNAKGGFTRYYIEETTQVAHLDSHHAE